MFEQRGERFGIVGGGDFAKNRFYLGVGVWTVMLLCFTVEIGM